MKNIYVAICLFCTVLLASFAQAQTGKINGLVKSADNKSIDAATVSLLHAKDSSLAKIAVTDKAGAFEFDKLNTGSYLLQIEAIGYTKYTGNAFELTAQKSSLQINSIQLQTASNSISGVSVTTKRPLIENKIDKTVVNVDASPTNAGLTALEVLEKSPGVTVDADGNVSLKGKQGVTILIDGKPTYLSGQDLANYLKNMSSNQLDQIEIMTQPSAKYDASGNSGVINIKTKKNRNSGLNGTITTSAIIAQYFKNTNNLNLNWRKNKVNLFGTYGYTHWEGFNEINLERDSRKNRETNFDRYVIQKTNGRYTGITHTFKAGMDYFASKNTTIGFAVNGNFEDNKFSSSSHADIFDSLHKYVQYNDALSQTHDPWTNLGFNLNFQQKLDTSGQELTADADYILYRTKGKQYSNNYLYNADGTMLDGTPNNPNPYLLNGYLPADIDIYSFKSDYKKPFKKDFTLEAGIKVSYVKTDNDAQYTLFDNNIDKWQVDHARSNHFIYKENINAAYVNLQKQYKKLGVQLGLRAEQTIADGKQTAQNVAPFHLNYTKLFPTTYFSYKLNDKNTLGLSYGRRIERPGYQQLNPFQYQLDRYTYQQGNPDLQPQFSHNVELSYNYKGQLNVALNYTAISDIINDVLKSVKLDGDSNYTTFQTTENIASSRNIGLSVSYNKQLKKWWTINAFANVYNNEYTGVIDDEQIHVNLTSFNANLSSQFNFNKGWSAEVSGWMNTKQYVSSAILAYPMGFFSLGGGKQILKNKGTIRINLRDPFYIMSFKGMTDLDKGVLRIHNYWDNRRAVITFTYRFGKANGQQQRRRSSASDEQNRVNIGGGQQ